jgi:hypothetical protein
MKTDNNALKGYSTQFLIDLKWCLDLRLKYQKEIAKKCGCANRAEFKDCIIEELKRRNYTK